jgi:hypothetical protein
MKIKRCWGVFAVDSITSIRKNKEVGGHAALHHDGDTCAILKPQIYSSCSI